VIERAGYKSQVDAQASLLYRKFHLVYLGPSLRPCSLGLPRLHGSTEWS
jgi:hypothetical protein